MNSLSVIIVNYNTFLLTCDCIRSVLSVDRNSLDLQVILVDNGSTEYQERPFTEIFPDIQYVRSDVNVGFSKGNNLGLAYATKAYALLLNSDTIVTDASVFGRSIEIIRENSDRLVLTCRLLTPDGATQTAYGYLPGPWIELLLTSFLYKVIPTKMREDLLISFNGAKQRLITNGYITATFYMFPRNALERIPKGKLYDNLFLYGEELFWATHWLSIGMPMYYAADISVVHLIGQSSKSDISVRRKYQIEAEHNFLVWKYSYITVAFIYGCRIFRFLILAPFDKDIRLRLSILFRLCLNKMIKNGR